MASRSFLLLGIAAAAIFAAAPACADPADMALGNPAAGVTVIEYASASCPYCAAFNAEVFPAFKAKYVDTGKVRYILRETPIHGAIDEAGFILARCAGNGRYFKVLDALLAGAETLEETNDQKSWITAGVKASGLTRAKVKTCLDDKAAKAAFKARFNANLRDHPVHATPTIFINGVELVANGYTLDVLDKAIAEAKPVVAAAPAPAHKTAKKVVKKKRG